MIRLDPIWDPYFDTLDPEERLALLDALPVRDGEKPIQDFCRALYRERYTHPKQPDRKADNWLWKLVYLPGLYKRGRFLGKGALKKEMDGTAKELRLSDPAALEEKEQAVLYREFRNAARRYLSTCDSPGYANSFMGMKRATREEKLDRACEDIWMSSRGVALAAGMEDRFRLWCDALYAELLRYDPGSQRHYTELELNFKK